MTGNQSAALNPIAQAQSYDTVSFEQSFDDYDPILDDEPNDSRPAMAMQLVSAQSVNNQTYSGAFQGKTPKERLIDTMNYLKGLLGNGTVSHIQVELCLRVWEIMPN